MTNWESAYSTWPVGIPPAAVLSPVLSLKWSLLSLFLQTCPLRYVVLSAFLPGVGGGGGEGG